MKLQLPPIDDDFLRCINKTCPPKGRLSFRRMRLVHNGKLQVIFYFRALAGYDPTFTQYPAEVRGMFCWDGGIAGEVSACEAVFLRLRRHRRRNEEYLQQLLQGYYVAYRDEWLRRRAQAIASRKGEAA